ncbi:MAG: hypothetical protein R2761_25680 [Acidimicrobiales bacterium]
MIAGAAPCPACGDTPATGDARYCRRCGAGLGSGLGPASSAGLVAGDTVRRDATSARRWIGGAAAAAIMLALAWALARPGDGGSSDRTADTAPAGNSDDSLPSTTTTRAGYRDLSQEPPPDSRVVDEGDGPVLGRPTGWSLLVGDSYDAYGRGLWRIDLDTGRQVNYPEVGGGPVLVAGDRLLLLDIRYEDGTSTLRSVLVADPAGPVGPTTLQAPYIDYPGAIAPADPATGGSVWVFSGQGSSRRWLLLSAVTGGVLDEITLGPGGWLAPPGGPDLATSADWGIYRRDGSGGFRLLAPGRPIEVAGGDVLVQSCSAPTICRLAWVDATDGKRVDRPVPPGDQDHWWFGLVPGSDRFLNGLRRTDHTDRREISVVFDLVAGRMVDTGSEGLGVASSPDGRYLFMASDYGPSGEAMSIYDTETGETFPLPRPTGVGNAQAVFVPNG